MRGISKDNIEEWLFQYHEDLLDVAQKKDLLHFLVQNPEYNDDFVLWGSARLGAEEIRIPEAFTERLKRKNPVLTWYSEVWLSFGASVCLSLLSVYFLQPSFEVEVPKVIPTQMPSIRKGAMDSLQTAAPKVGSLTTKVRWPSNNVSVAPALVVDVQDSVWVDVPMPLSLEPLALDTHIHIVQRNGWGTPLSLLPVDSSQKGSVKKASDRGKKSSQKLAPFSINPVEEFQTDHPNF